MEEYFSVGWTNPSQFITFQVTKQTKRKQTAECEGELINMTRAWDKEKF